jgi:uncharacterized protein YPO0396
VSEIYTGLFKNVTNTRGLSEQFRLERFQVFNWGTFQDYHDIPVPREGFLFLGASGSWKTTLLDAISTMLNPYASVEYNTSARDAKRNDRTLLSYVRGAWAAKTEEDSGEISTDFLRKGSTWSAIALTYKLSQGDIVSNLRRVRVVTLLQLFWLKNNVGGPVQRHYMITERDLDLDSIKFGVPKLDLRAFKNDFPTEFHSKDFSTYSERFRRLLGIESEKALKLLQKTQSMKNVEHLETFLKEYMLDTPKTFQNVDDMAREFIRLNDSHEIVVTAAEQIKVLDEARLCYRSYERNQKMLSNAQDIVANLRNYFGLKTIELLKSEEIHDEAQKSAREVLLRESEEKHKKAQSDLERLRALQLEKGGDAIRLLEENIERLERDLRERGKNRDLAMDICRELGFTFPDNALAFGDLRERAEKERLELAAKELEESKQYETQTIKKGALQEELSKIQKEVKNLETQRTNIPHKNLEMRNRALNALGLEDWELPFVGELLDVKPREKLWQGAIERAYKDLALLVLVSDKHTKALTEYINSSNLKGSFGFIRMSDNKFDSLTPLDEHNLSQKLEIKDFDHKDWLSRELRRAYDYYCAESLTEVYTHEYALTASGTVKRGRTWYEKDDSYEIKDRARWVIGFSNREKLEHFRKLRNETEKQLKEQQTHLDHLDESRKLRANRDRNCEKILELSFEKINVQILIDEIESDKAKKRELEKDPELKNLQRSIEKQTKVLADALNAFVAANSAYSLAERKLIDTVKKLQNAVVEFSTASVSFEISEKISKIVEAEHKELNLSTIQSLENHIRTKIHEEILLYKGNMQTDSLKVEELFKVFKKRWPNDSSDQEALISNAPEFLAMLDRLEREDLPRFEKDFFMLLNRQSGVYATQLNKHLDDEVQEILERLEEVNRCLRDVPFNMLDNNPTFLTIKSNPKYNPDLVDLKKRLTEISSYTLNDSRATAEKRFLIQKKLVEDLTSQDRDKILWRENVIDVRNQLEFIGVETNVDGEEVESYRSGSGKSGGQRQKLAATCLAAALRYQLGGKDLGFPAYATVVFDEAFAKTDNEHTKLAMDIFSKLGFQMIMASPNKMVKVAEPFIGGAAYIFIEKRNSSHVSLIIYDHERKQLVFEEDGVVPDLSVLSDLAPSEED